MDRNCDRRLYYVPLYRDPTKFLSSGTRMDKPRPSNYIKIIVKPLQNSVPGMIWCDGTADWVIRLAPAQSYRDRERQLLTRVDRPCASEMRWGARACVHTYARVHEVGLRFPTSIPRGSEKTKRNTRRANPLRSRPTRNVQRTSRLNVWHAITRHVRVCGEPPPTARKWWKIVISTPVTRRFRMIHRLI